MNFPSDLEVPMERTHRRGNVSRTCDGGLAHPSQLQDVQTRASIEEESLAWGGGSGFTAKS